MFYEVYPGNINNMSQFQCMVDKARGYGYRNMGFILDRGYFSKDNINRQTDFLRSHINKFKGFGPGIEIYFDLTYEENAKKKGKDNTEQTSRKFVFFEERAYVIEEELNLCGYFVIITSDKMTAKIFVEFVALIIRNRMYNYLKDAEKEMPSKPDFMSVPAAIRELDKIEMARQLSGVYTLDHAVTAKQKTILSIFFPTGMIVVQF